MTNKKVYPNPKFKNIEEEDQYWATHSPLDEGYEGKIQSIKKNLTSILTVRLTGSENTALRDIAAELGMGPSTYARIVLKSVIKEHQANTQQIAPSSKIPGIKKNDEGHYVLSEEEVARVSRVAEEINLLKVALEDCKENTSNSDKN